MTAQQIAQMLALLQAIDQKLERMATLLVQIERTMPAMVEWAESPFRLTPPEQPEAVLQEQCVRVLNMLLVPPAFFFSAAIGACQLTMQQAAALSRAGIKRGLPDLMILHDGKLRGVELKLRHGRLSKTRMVRTKRGSPRILDGQEDVFPRLEAAGMEIAVCRSLDEVINQLTLWKIPLRGYLAGKLLPRADEIYDPNFTGGMESAEYVRRLYDGTR